MPKHTEDSFKLITKKMAKLKSSMVVFLMGLVLTANPVKAIDCLSVFSSFLPCANFLGNFLPILPGNQCCSSVGSLVGNGDIESLCQCFRLNPLGSGFLPSKAQQLPDLCSVATFLPLVKCLIPSGENAIPLPPATIPLSPVFELPPVEPTVPLPPVFALPPVDLAVPIPPVFALPPVEPTVPLPPAFALPPVV
ncbi:hypothetical protein ABFX02_13G127800 [Erythranthe guttata]